MTSTLIDVLAERVLRLAAASAASAPSVHNTQPWHFAIRGRQMEVRADWSRKLSVLDPSGRQLLISCGCALLNARVEIASQGWACHVDRFPAAARSPVAARVILDARGAAGPLAALEPILRLRQTNRRPFAAGEVDGAVVDDLVRCAAGHGATLLPLARREHRLVAARWTQLADRTQNADPRYRAEVRKWTSAEPGRLDGVPGDAIPHVTGGARDDLPIRDFDTTGVGALPETTASAIEQSLFLLATQEDRPLAWLEAGEALEHIWLAATRNGYAMSLFTQPIEVPWIRLAMRAELGMTAYPHLLMRVGRAASTPFTSRRRLEELLVEEG